MCLADAAPFAGRMSVLVTNIKMLTETLPYPVQAVKSVFPSERHFAFFLQNRILLTRSDSSDRIN